MLVFTLIHHQGITIGAISALSLASNTDTSLQKPDLLLLFPGSSNAGMKP